MKKLLILSLATIAFAGCGKKEDFKYTLSENGCSTGEQQADSKDQMCAKLKNDSVNNNCAYSLRKQKFESDGCGTWGS